VKSELDAAGWDGPVVMSSIQKPAVRNSPSAVAEGGVDYFVAQTAVWRRAGSTLRLPLEVDQLKLL